jgi:hypothetical protein
MSNHCTAKQAYRLTVSSIAPAQAIACNNLFHTR